VQEVADVSNLISLLHDALLEQNNSSEVLYNTKVYALEFISNILHNLNPSYVSIMSTMFHIWASIIELLIVTLSGVFIAVYSLVTLCMADRKTEGVLKLFVNTFVQPRD